MSKISLKIRNKTGFFLSMDRIKGQYHKILNAFRVEWILWMSIDLTYNSYIQNISVKRIRCGFSTSFYDKNYLPVSYSNIIISKTHLNPPKPW